jgi:hypothetical protein
MLATEPGHTAIVLVALAGMAGTPTKSNAGKEIKLPPPATELIAPDISAAKNKKTA